MAKPKRKNSQGEDGADAAHAPPDLPPRPYSDYSIFFRIEQAHLLQSTGTVEKEILAAVDPSHHDPVEHPRPARYRSLILPPYWYLSSKGAALTNYNEKRKKRGVVDRKALNKIISVMWKQVDAEVKAYCKKLATADLDRYNALVEVALKKLMGGGAAEDAVAPSKSPKICTVENSAAANLQDVGAKEQAGADVPNGAPHRNDGGSDGDAEAPSKSPKICSVENAGAADLKDFGAKEQAGSVIPNGAPPRNDGEAAEDAAAASMSPKICNVENAGAADLQNFGAKEQARADVPNGAPPRNYGETAEDAADPSKRLKICEVGNAGAADVRDFVEEQALRAENLVLKSRLAKAEQEILQLQQQRQRGFGPSTSSLGQQIQFPQNHEILTPLKFRTRFDTEREILQLQQQRQNGLGLSPSFLGRTQYLQNRGLLAPPNCRMSFNAEHEMLQLQQQRQYGFGLPTSSLERIQFPQNHGISVASEFRACFNPNASLSDCGFSGMDGCGQGPSRSFFGGDHNRDLDPAKQTSHQLTGSHPVAGMTAKGLLELAQVRKSSEDKLAQREPG